MSNVELPRVKDPRALLPPGMQRAAHRLVARGLDAGLPAPPLGGRLPLRRFIPQDVHSVMDYAGALGAWAVGHTSRSSRARAVGLALGLSGVTVALLTDYRLSVRKLIPIRTHEAIDYAWSAALLAAPLLLGYRRRHPAVARAHALIAAGTLLGSLFTDYRAQAGVSWKRPAAAF